MSLCVNPDCPQPKDSRNEHRETCCHCGTTLRFEGNYRAIAQLGSGGFAKVSEVTNGDRTYVLKVLSDGSANAAKLFRREAETLEKLSHPGIPKLAPSGYFTISIPNSRHLIRCLMMEKIEGRTLDRWLASGECLSEKLLLNWLKQILEIVIYLHERRYIHRDIKPENLILQPDRKLALIDFGAVRERTDTFEMKLAERTSVTRIFSESYAPPEQKEGRVVAASDLFAIGKTFVHLATGKNPDTFPTDMYGEPIWQDAAPQISEEVKNAIAQLLDEKPSCRIAAPELLQQLQALDRADPPPLPADAPPWQKWMRTVETAGRALTRSLATPGKIAKWRSLILVITALITVAAATPIWQRRMVVDNIKNCAFAIQEGKLATAQEFCKRAIALAPRNGTARYTLGRVFEKNEDYERAESQYQMAIDLGNVAAHSQLARLYLLDREILHRDLFDSGCEAAVPLLQKGLQARPNAIERYRMRKNLGWAYACLGDSRQAERELKRAIAFGNERDLTGDRGAPHCLLARVYESRAGTNLARKSWEKCLEFAHDGHSIEVDLWKKDAKERLQNMAKMGE